MTVSQQEQDDAAGGSEFRDLLLPDGTVVKASLSVRRYARSPHQCYGYLQFKVNKKTVTKYVGRVTASSRFESLRLGWELVRSRKLAEAYSWSWLS